MTDKVKIRVTSTMVKEVELNPEWYLPEDRTPERMLEIELNNAKELSIEYFETVDSQDIKGEVVG